MAKSPAAHALPMTRRARLNFESDEWPVAHATSLEEEGKLIEAGFEFVRYGEKDEVAIYRRESKKQRQRVYWFRGPVV